MNERIKLLANEAAKFSAVMALPTGETGNKLFVEKFAELIVRECLEQVRDEVQYEYDWKLADAVTKRVLEHFGVEE